MTRATPSDDRGQIVLVAAAVVAVALLSMTLAYAHLGYDADRTGAGATEVASASELHRSLTASLRVAAHEAVRSGDGPPPWRDRRTAATAVRASLTTEVDRLQRVHAGESRSVSIELAPDAAARWAGSRCPNGPGREFGPCRAIDGVVVQERAGETAVVAAAFRIRIVSPAESTTITTISRAVPPSTSGHGSPRQPGATPPDDGPVVASPAPPEPKRIKDASSHIQL